MRILMRMRIIPAYAGSTEGSLEGGVPAEDHPRVCGEHQADRCFYGPDLGSSPRMRGALGGLRRRVVDDQDHPRVCGEHGAQIRVFEGVLGSSPRMRGAQSQVP